MNISRLRLLPLLGVWLIASTAPLGCSDKSGQKADPKSQARNDSTVKPPKSPAKTEKPSDSNTDPSADAKRKEQQAQAQKEKERLRLEEEKKKTEEAIRDATVLQAPPLPKGKYHETGDFGKTMKEFAENEFRFREAKGKVFRSAFDQRTMEYSPVLKRFHARNAVVSPGRYDFDTGIYNLDLVFWEHLYEEKKRPKDVIDAARTDDICKLQAQVKVDAKTAERWRTAIDKKEFSITVWYRLAKIERADWQQNPHWNPVPMLAHDIAFSVEVLKVE